MPPARPGDGSRDNGTEEAVEDEDEEVREAIRLSLLDTPPGSREGSQREAEVETRGPSGEEPARQLVDAVETIALRPIHERRFPLTPRLRRATDLEGRRSSDPGRAGHGAPRPTAGCSRRRCTGSSQESVSSSSHRCAGPRLAATAASACVARDLVRPPREASYRRRARVPLPAWPDLRADLHAPPALMGRSQAPRRARLTRCLPGAPRASRRKRAHSGSAWLGDQCCGTKGVACRGGGR